MECLNINCHSICSNIPWLKYLFDDWRWRLSSPGDSVQSWVPAVRVVYTVGLQTNETLTTVSMFKSIYKRDSGEVLLLTIGWGECKTAFKLLIFIKYLFLNHLDNFFGNYGTKANKKTAHCSRMISYNILYMYNNLQRRITSNKLYAINDISRPYRSGRDS